MSKLSGYKFEGRNQDSLKTPENLVTILEAKSMSECKDAVFVEYVNDNWFHNKGVWVVVWARQI